jgi:hypothetical protein
MLSPGAVLPIACPLPFSLSTAHELPLPVSHTRVMVIGCGFSAKRSGSCGMRAGTVPPHLRRCKMYAAHSIGGGQSSDVKGSDVLCVCVCGGCVVCCMPRAMQCNCSLMTLAMRCGMSSFGAHKRASPPLSPARRSCAPLCASLVTRRCPAPTPTPSEAPNLESAPARRRALVRPPLFGVIARFCLIFTSLFFFVSQHFDVFPFCTGELSSRLLSADAYSDAHPSNTTSSPLDDPSTQPPTEAEAVMCVPIHSRSTTTSGRSESAAAGAEGSGAKGRGSVLHGSGGAGGSGDRRTRSPTFHFKSYYPVRLFRSRSTSKNGGAHTQVIVCVLCALCAGDFSYAAYTGVWSER